MKSFEELYEEDLAIMFAPYSDEELRLFAKDRVLKSTIEWILAHNWQLIFVALETLDYLNGKGEKPASNISREIYPGYDHDHNSACKFINALGELIIKYGEGECPMLRVVTYCSRSTITLISLLKRINPTPELVDAEYEATHIFNLLTYRGAPTMSAEKFASHVRECCQHFIEACKANARKLGSCYAQRKQEIEHPTAPSQQPATKSDLAAATDKLEAVATDTNHRVRKLQHDTNGHKRFTDEQIERCYAIWERGKSKFEVKANCHGKATHDAVFNFYIRELKSIGIASGELFSAALAARAKRISYRNDSK